MRPALEGPSTHVLVVWLHAACPEAAQSLSVLHGTDEEPHPASQMPGSRRRLKEIVALDISIA